MTHVTVIGAGSAIFGRGTICDLLASEELSEQGLSVTLVDVDEEALAAIHGLACFPAYMLSFPCATGGFSSAASYPAGCFRCFAGT
jgi:hypothetical protein